MEILISVTAKIAEYTVVPVGRQLGYVFFIHSNFQKLNTQVERLKDTRESVQQKICTARRNVEDIKPAVEKWLKKVDDFARESDEILANEGEHGRLCSTNLVQRYMLSRKASKMAYEVLEMKNEGESFDSVSYKNVIPSVDCSLPKVPDFFDFDSRNSIVEQIMGAFSDDNVHRIGVYGMGGVGKTMLVKEILRKIVVSKCFDEVVTSTISQTPDFKSIQGQLADKLGLKFEQETIEGRARILRKRLKMERSILVVLDDIWEYIDLERIGIPSTVEGHTRCKILFTSRNTHLLSNEMRANKIFEIKVLREDESWTLFKAMAGEIVEASDLKPIASKIVKECAGLPIAITTVAKALRHKPSDIWNDALDQLKSVDVVMANIGEMDKKVYLSLKLSYDCLGYEEVKLLFLLCSMFPEDFSIDVEELHVYAMAMGFLHGVDTVVKGRRRIKKLVDDLISSSLLQLYSKYGKNYVKMHDLVRDVAILIASKSDHIRTLSYVKRLNEEWKEEKLSGNHTVVSIHGLHYPLPKLMLPKVQLLRLDGVWLKTKYVSVVETFFEEMKELKGLVLKHVNISLLPRPSLYSLANIRLLCLHGCELGSIDKIGELKQLEVLDFSGSNITQIPTTMSQLTQLKVLNLSSCHELKVIPPNILSKLTKLEELSLETFDRWEVEEWYEGRKNASLSELKCLPHLYALNLTIQDEEIMPKHLFLAGELNLEIFYITIGCQRNIGYQRNRGYIIDNKANFLRIKMKSERCLDDWIKFLLKRSEEVLLEESICTKVLHSILVDANDFVHLKKLYLGDNSELQHFIHEKNKPLRKYLSKLEYLYLHTLENLESVIHGYSHGESPFNNLKKVNIWNCNELKTLFLNCMLDDVLNLEEIEINHCEKMEVMFTVKENEEATNHIEFTHLKSLSLWYLPRLQKFCSKMEKFEQLSEDNSKNLETSTVSKTINIGESFFSEEVSLPNLETLRICDAENLKMIWSNNVLTIPNSFSKLKEVVIYSCNNLQKVLFPPNMMSILTCLYILRIKNCELLEGIFEVQEPSVTETNLVVLQNLSKLKLCYLPNLEYVWSKNNSCELLSLVNIKSWTINECPRLTMEYSVEILKQLEALSIDIKQLMEVIGKKKSANHNRLESKQLETSSCKIEVLQLGDGCELFPKLKTLKLYGFVEDDSTHLPMEIVQILYQLEAFELEGAFIEEIFPSNILIPMKKQYYARRSKISQRSWVLSKLPKLTHLGNECLEMNNDSILQDLTSLSISECGRLSSLVSSSVSSFTNLRILEVKKCDGLTHLLNLSVATTLVQLEELRIKECKRMSSVIEGGSTEEDGRDEATNQIEFTHLKTLVLTGVPQLQKFCSKTETFGEFSGDNLENAEESTIYNSFFSEQVSLPNLETLRIDGAENLKMIWSNNVLTIPNFFSKLKEVVIDSCNNLRKVLFPPNMMSILTCLDILRIENCELLEGIFEVQEPSITETSLVVLRNLSELKLCNLPNLEYVWSKNNPCELLSFVNIKSLLIDKCSRFKRKYSVKILRQNERLNIDIKQLMEVIKKEKSADHSILEPKQLEKSSSKVGVLQLGYGSKLFPNLKHLKLYGSVEYNSTHLPVEILQILYQLKDFEFEGAFIEEIFPSNIMIPSYMILWRLTLSKLPKLKHLWSEEYSQNNISSVLQDLHHLNISKCGRLSSLVSSLVCFTNLKYLAIYKCDGLTHLLNPSVATMLVQLRHLDIQECKRISSVIERGSVEEDGNDEIIVFNNLQYLIITSCSNLTSFYCGRCIIKFPRLNEVCIKKCPEMKVFSLGVVSTPHLKYENVSLENDYGDKWCHLKYPKDMLVEDMNIITREYWEDNIDTRIPNLFAEQSLEENQSENSSSSNNNVEK